MIVEFCDGCHQLPVEFETDKNGVFYWVILDKDGEAAHLTDDLLYKFLCIKEKLPERLKGKEYYCWNCIEKMDIKENIG